MMRPLLARMLAPLLGMGLALASCSTLPVDNADQGIVPVQPIRWRLKPGCLRDAPQAPGQTRNTLAPGCQDPAGVIW